MKDLFADTLFMIGGHIGTFTKIMLKSYKEWKRYREQSKKYLLKTFSSLDYECESDMKNLTLRFLKLQNSEIFFTSHSYHWAPITVHSLHHY